MLFQTPRSLQTDDPSEPLGSKTLSPSLRTNWTFSSVPGRPDEGEMFIELIISKYY